MSGIGIKLNKIYGRRTLTTNLIGFGYSLVLTVAPMILVIAAVLAMHQIFGVAELNYARRELYSCTVLYCFIFSLLTTSPFNSVLSRYLSDVIYNETYGDIIPAYNLGLLINTLFSCLLGIPFCIHEYMTGQVPIIYVFTGFCCYIALVHVFYSMLYLSICKDYKKMSMFYFLGMILTVTSSMFFVWVLGMEKTYAMLLGLTVGFILIAILEYSLVQHYFRKNSGVYKPVLVYFKRYWMLVVTNFMYTLGLYIHNFVFWTTDLRMVVADSFVCVQTYDMATCIAMFINISTTIIFITRVEMNFNDRYKAYSNAVIGGRGADIDNAKSRMFRQLSEEIMSLVRIQFIITVVLYFLTVILLPRFGFGGSTMRIYPCLTVGYFILFVMYSTIIFLYYFNDNFGAMLTAVTFFAVTMVGTIFATSLPDLWYGIGVVAGATSGFIMGYHRIRWVERHLDVHTFCEGDLIRKGRGDLPNPVSFTRYTVWEQRLKDKDEAIQKENHERERQERDMETEESKPAGERERKKQYKQRKKEREKERKTERENEKKEREAARKSEKKKERKTEGENEKKERKAEGKNERKEREAARKNERKEQEAARKNERKEREAARKNERKEREAARKNERKKEREAARKNEKKKGAERDE